MHPYIFICFSELNKIKRHIIENKLIVFCDGCSDYSFNGKIKKLNDYYDKLTPCQAYDIIFSKINVFLEIHNINYTKEIYTPDKCYFKFEHYDTPKFFVCNENYKEKT